MTSMDDSSKSGDYCACQPSTLLRYDLSVARDALAARTTKVSNGVTIFGLFAAEWLHQRVQ